MTDQPRCKTTASPDGPANTADAAQTIVRLRDVHLKLGSASGEVNILNGVSLTLQAGETVGVVGRSGSGKTSTLMVTAGLEAVTSGDIRVCGHDLKGMSEDALALLRRDNIGVVFQGFHLIPTMTALENVAVPLELAGAANALSRARQCLKDVGLEDRAGHYPGQLSGGEQQRVALARAFAPQPKLLLADEPTGNLDGSTGGKIMDMIFAMVADRGVTMMLVTHDPALAARCDRVVRMESGRFIDATAGENAR